LFETGAEIEDGSTRLFGSAKIVFESLDVVLAEIISGLYLDEDKGGGVFRVFDPVGCTYGDVNGSAGFD
jgi:hypothetical protein